MGTTPVWFLFHLIQVDGLLFIVTGKVKINPECLGNEKVIKQLSCSVIILVEILGKDNR